MNEFLQDPFSPTAYINGTPLSSFSAVLQDFSVSAVQVTSSQWQGVNRTNFTLLKQQFGLRSITLSVGVFGQSFADAAIMLSKLNLALWGKADITLPDGFSYFCVLDGSGDAPERVGPGTGETGLIASFSLTGYRHGPIITTTGPTVYCPSTTPQTDCILSVTVGAAADSYTLGGATFPNVTQGEQLVFDGINKRILRNGAPVAAGVEWINFPYLTPGENAVSAADPVTVQFYPCYM